MNEKSDRLICAIGEIDEKYVKESENMGKGSIIKIAVCFSIIIALGLFLFLPYPNTVGDLSAYADSEYFPLIEVVEEYRLSYLEKEPKNNFEKLSDMLLGGVKDGIVPPPTNNMDFIAESNGAYVEATDNQVEGVIESDLIKMTDKYIFRLGARTNKKILRVYSIEQEQSKLVGQFELPSFEGQRTSSQEEMYLSPDGNTVIVLMNFKDAEYNNKIGVISIDVSDLANISLNATVNIDGNLNTSRMVDGKLLMISEYYFNRKNVDYKDPTSFVPTIDGGDGPRCIELDDIIFPEGISNTRYSVVTLLDVDSLDPCGAKALLNYTSEVYVSENNVYIAREYVNRINEENSKNYTLINTTDVAVINYSEGELVSKGIISLLGHVEDRFSFDEREGYLRVVTSTLEQKVTLKENSDFIYNTNITRNASLYIYDLSDNSLAYSVEDFAIEGEEATAVRFEGDELYVCTAVVISFTDPVYFFDLSDYENITFSDTGIIEGYSTSLIDFGSGLALGIGVEDWQYNKVELYEQSNNGVISVDKYMFIGEYSEEYKAYLVDRDNKLFGFGVNYYRESEDSYPTQGYILLYFNGYELIPFVFEVDSLNRDTVRAVYLDGYLYITTESELKVEKIK